MDNRIKSVNQPKLQSRLAWTFIRISVVIAIIYFLINSGALNLIKLGKMLKNGWIYLGFFCLFISVFFAVFRWKVLLNSVEIHTAFGKITRLTFIGLAFNTIIPGAVSGDIIKAYYLVRGKSRKAEAIITIILDRLIGLFTFFVTAGVAIIGVLIFGGGIVNTLNELRDIKIMGLIVIILALVMVFGFLICLSVRFSQSVPVRWLTTNAPGHTIIYRIYNTIFSFRDKKRALLLAMSLSIIVQFPLILAMYFFNKGANDTALTFTHYLFCAPIALILNAIPLGPGGLGTGEAFVYALFKLFGSLNGANVMAMFHIAMIILSVIGFLLYILRKSEITVTDKAERLDENGAYDI